MRTISLLRCTHRRMLVIAAAIASLIATRSTLAGPYEWTGSQIQGLGDVTPQFHGGAGQLSTIDSISPIPNGIELEVTFRIGQDSDPFAPDYGLSFARVSLQGALAALDLSAYSSSSLKVTTTTDITVQSFLLTNFEENGTTIDDGDANPLETFNQLFWEHVDNVAAPVQTDVDFDFSNATEFDGNWNLSNPQSVQGTDSIDFWGVQLAKFSGMAIGAPVNATVTIVGVIPEPASASFVCLAALGLVGFHRRRCR